MTARSALALGTIYNGAYPLGVNRDILLAAAVLHDIGKIDEIDPDNRRSHTIAGNLVGHIVLGHRAVMAAAQEVADLEERDLLHLEHLLLSHHGRREWGAAQEPKTAEAILLHYADDCDAKLNIFFGALEKDRAEGDFTPFHKILGRTLYKKGVLEPPEPESPGEQTQLDL
jgi:3'-5' exoribonuclease